MAAQGLLVSQAAAPGKELLVHMVPHSPLRLVLIGPPAGGKGTISRWIQRDFGPLAVVSTGGLLRAMSEGTIPCAPGTTIASMQQFLASGNLMEDEQITDILSGALASPATSRWLLDGYPRTARQARFLDERMLGSGQAVDAVIFLDISQEAIVERIADRWVHPPSGRSYSASFNPPLRHGFDDATGEPLQRRSDDHMECFLKRMAAYKAHLGALEEYYCGERAPHAAAAAATAPAIIRATGKNSNQLYETIKARLDLLTPQ